MSPDLRARISQDILSVGNDPAISSRLGATGQVVRPSAPEEFAASIEKQRATVTAAAARLGLKAAQQ